MVSTNDGVALNGLAELQARNAIGRLIALYGQLLDDVRLDDWSGLFTEDAIWRNPQITFEGRARIVAGVGAMEPPVPRRVRHLSFTPVIDFESPTQARAWTDQIALHRPEDAWLVAAVGRYHDVVRLDGERWRFARREADLDWPPGSDPLSGILATPGR